MLARILALIGTLAQPLMAGLCLCASVDRGADAACPCCEPIENARSCCESSAGDRDARDVADLCCCETESERSDRAAPCAEPAPIGPTAAFALIPASSERELTARVHGELCAIASHNRRQAQLSVWLK